MQYLFCTVIELPFRSPLSKGRYSFFYRERFPKLYKLSIRGKLKVLPTYYLKKKKKEKKQNENDGKEGRKEGK